MPHVFSHDPLSVDIRSEEFPIVVSSARRDLEPVRLTLKDLPRGKGSELRQRLTIAQNLTRAALAQVSMVTMAGRKAGESVFEDQIRRQYAHLGATKEYHLALNALYLVKREIVKWGVAGHNPEDFLRPDRSPIPFEEVSDVYNGRTYKVPSDRMVRMYEKLGEEYDSGGVASSLIVAIADAILEFNSPGKKVRTPEEVWADTEKETAAVKAELQAAAERAKAAAEGKDTGAKEAPAPDPLAVSPGVRKN